MSLRLYKGSPEASIKMPTVNRFSINESDPEIMHLETVEITQNFSNLTLGKERNFLISNDGNEVLLAFQNSSEFEESDNLVSFFNINFENNSNGLQPLILDREDLYSEAGLTKIFYFNYF